MRNRKRGAALRRWLEENDVKGWVFAERCGVDASTVSRWQSGVLPKPEHMHAIIRETAGDVCASDFYTGGEQ